jgi:hypothetical protein
LKRVSEGVISFEPISQVAKKIVEKCKMEKLDLIEMVDDSTYEGEWLNGKGHGKGKYVFKDKYLGRRR